MTTYQDGSRNLSNVAGSVPGVIRPARSQDLSAIQTLLKTAELPTAGVAEHLHEFLVVEDVGHLIAAAGLEVYGTAALLRSVAVHQDHRNRGVAGALTGQLLSRARSSGVRDVYLLTTSAQRYFQRFGFQVVPREAIDPAVTRSAEFGERCCTTAVAMRLQLRDGGLR